MVRHKIIRTLVVAASLVAMVTGSMPVAFLFADEFPPPSIRGVAASPPWDLSTLTVYESSDASINVSVDSAGIPFITAVADQDASSGTFTFSMVSDDGFESMLISGEVLADGSISCQTVHANLAIATSSAGGAAAWAAADSEPGFWDDYWRYFWNPSDMDPGLEVGFYVSAGVGVTAGTVATGGIIYYGPAAALPTLFGGGAAAGTATATGTGVLSRAALQAALVDARAQLNWWIAQNEFIVPGTIMAKTASERIAYWRSEIAYLEYALQQLGF